jgi:hypothetical protein
VFGWPDPNTGFDQSEHALYTCYFIKMLYTCYFTKYPSYPTISLIKIQK